METYYIGCGKFNANDVYKEEGERFCLYRYGIEKWVDTIKPKELRKTGEETAKRQIEINREGYNALLALADSVAENAHAGQFDKSGKPYITHPRTVASFLQDTEHKIIALLHDTIEDTDITPQKLTELGFTDRIVRSVLCLTHADGVDYFDYLDAMRDDPNARYVKAADLMHNMDMSRLENPTERDYERLKKYQKAMEVIKAWD